MGLIKEFLQWRKEKKEMEFLKNSWLAPYVGHEPTEERTCYTDYELRFNLLTIPDDIAVGTLIDVYGPKQVCYTGK